MEDIYGLQSSFSSLFVAENQVDPFVDVLGDVIGLQSLPVDQDEQPSITSAPIWQNDIVNSLAGLPHSKIEACNDS